MASALISCADFVGEAGQLKFLIKWVKYLWS